MKQRGKKYSNWKEKNYLKKDWSLSEVLEIILENKLEKFQTTLNLTFYLNLNSKRNEHNIKGQYTLPHTKSKELKIIVFTKDYSGDIDSSTVQKIGGLDLINEISKTKKIDADVVIATPEIMANLGKIAPILGPKKIMPSVKHKTVTRDLKSIIDEYKKGKRSFYTDGSKSIHFILGTIKDTKEKLIENYEYLYELIIKVRPKSIKGKYIKGIYISSTMGPGFKIQPS